MLDNFFIDQEETRSDIDVVLQSYVNKTIVRSREQRETSKENGT